jgi:hypothetical protein
MTNTIGITFSTDDVALLDGFSMGGMSNERAVTFEREKETEARNRTGYFTVMGPMPASSQLSRWIQVRPKWIRDGVLMGTGGKGRTAH